MKEEEEEGGREETAAEGARFSSLDRNLPHARKTRRHHGPAGHSDPQSNKQTGWGRRRRRLRRRRHRPRRRPSQ
eukprot:952433-Pyramimonas_sp.AAC.1